VGNSFSYTVVEQRDRFICCQSQEITKGLNYFVSGHRFKFTLESPYLGINDEGKHNPNYPNQIAEGWRMRLQLDISF
jgi:hypothetical protein